MFDISGKVALVTGGASGIGIEIVKELLRNGLRGCTIADFNESFGQKALETIAKEFGPNRAIFVKTDVVDKTQFQAAFEATIKEFKNIDILVNNAGILNDLIWERQLLVNVQGVSNGILLGLESYLQKYRTGYESVIINSSSIVGLDVFYSFPMYSACKHAVVGLTKAFGSPYHYTRTKVKVAAICPGLTDTSLISYDVLKKNVLGRDYFALFDKDTQGLPTQKPEYVAKAVAYIIKNGETGSVWVAEGGEPAYEVESLTREALKKSLKK